MPRIGVLPARPSPPGANDRSSKGTYAGGHLIITAGPWTAQVLDGLGLPLRVTRAVVYWFEPNAQREAFKAIDQGGMAASDMAAARRMPSCVNLNRSTPPPRAAPAVNGCGYGK